MIKELLPDDEVVSCDWIEMGGAMQLSGIHPCCASGVGLPPTVISVEELKSGNYDYEKIVRRRYELFLRLNGVGEPTAMCERCDWTRRKKYRDVDFGYLGGKKMSTAMNIQHYTFCNQRCSYCCYSKDDNFVKPSYNIIDFWEKFREKGKLRGNNWIDFSGGEPALLDNFDDIMAYIRDNRMGTVVLYTNASVYRQSIADALKRDNVFLTTSVDAGIKSQYRKIRGVDHFRLVLETLVKYRNTGTRGIWLKYVITDANRTEDDMWSFITMMMALRPDKVYVCPDFPYGDAEIPEETVMFAARLWCMVEKYVGPVAADFSSEFGDEKWQKYHSDLTRQITALRDTREFSYTSFVVPSTLTGPSSYDVPAMLEDKRSLETQLKAVIGSRTYRYGRKAASFIRIFFPKGSIQVKIIRFIMNPLRAVLQFKHK